MTGLAWLNAEPDPAPDPAADFRQALEAAGLIPGEVLADGTLRRCGTVDHPKSKNGWFIFYPDPPAGAFGDWSTGESQTWSNRGEALPPAERQRLRVEIEKQKSEREAKQKEKQSEAITKARQLWESLPPEPRPTPYTEAKGLPPPPGTRTEGTALVMPIYGPDGQLMNVERIFPDGTKRTPKDGPVSGGFCPIGPKGADLPLLIGEGLFTIYSCHLATGWPGLAARTAGNLSAVCKMARRLYPDREIIVLADFDGATEAERGFNPGKQSATEAAAAIGARLAIPPARAGQKMDFDDLRRSEGPEAVRTIIEGARPLAPEPGAEAHQVANDRPRIVAVDIRDLLSMDIPAREYVMEPIIPTQGLVLLHAQRGVGKTLLAMYAAYCITTAQELMRWKAPKPRPVLYIDGEMPAVTMQERSAGIVRGYTTEPEPGYLRFITPDLQERMPNLATAEGQASIEGHIEAAEVIFVDNLATLCRSGRENETESWHPVQDWILSLRRRGKTVVMVHHSNKSGGQRGTSSREDVLDTVIGLRRPSDYTPEQGARFEVHLEKARGIVGDGAKPFEAMLTTDEYGLLTWTCRDLEDAEAEAVARLKAEGLTLRDIAKETGLSKSKVHRLLRKGGTL